VLGGVQAALIATLVGRMYYLQVVQSDRYKMLADDNRINFQLLAPPRGRILDRFGQPLAYNKQQFLVTVIPERAPGIGATLDALAQLIDLSEHDRERIKKEVGRKRSFVPITIKENLTWEEMARIQVNAPDLPGINIDEGLTRYYPHGEAAAHLLGYVSAVDEADLNGDPLLQLPGFRIGKDGVEKVYDLQLRGKAGTSQVEVNAYGRAIRELEHHEGEAGSDVVLTIDERIQSYAGQRLGEESASLAVMDVHTGDLIALVSNPSFDANAFSRGLTAAEWKDLSTNDHKPLVNKVL
jgi:penicillin-binding protein 2